MKIRLKSLFSIRPATITAALTLLVIVLFLLGVPILDRGELMTYDLRFRYRGVQRPSPDIVLAVIDEKSLDGEGRWPWPRSRLAALIDVLSREGAKVIGFDIGFFEPDENTNLRFLSEFDQKFQSLKVTDSKLRDFLLESKRNADNDLNLANTIRAAKSDVVLGYFFHMSQAGLDYQIGEDKIKAQFGRISNSKYPLIIYADKTMMAEPFITAYAPEGNLEILSGAAEGSGYFNMFPDQDGVVRWMPLVIKCGPEIYSPLSIQILWHFLDRPQLMVRVAAYGAEGIRMGNRFIPTDENGQMLINYLGPAKIFPHYSISDILTGKTRPGSLKDKIVLVGATAVGIYDLRNTPFSPVYPGVEIHATVIDNVLNGRFIHKPKWTRVFDFLTIVVLGSLLGFAIPRIGAVKGMVFTLGLFAIHILLSQWLFSHYRIWVNMIYPLLTVVLVYTALTVYHYITEERERKKIRGAFSYYVSSSVVNEMLKNPDKLKLGGDKKDLSVLFSDIRGFTTISEGLTPEELVHLLNEYLTAMTDIVFKYDGTLDKYMGDAVMAIYGAPLDQPDHPSRACNSALDMMDGLKNLNKKWIREGKKPMDIGIGINTGMMMVGNMGSEQRFDYTVMGDAVNLGSRLEGANKNYKTNILLSEFTHDRVKDEFVCMELDSVRVKGKTLPVRIFHLVGKKGDVRPERREAITYFHRGLHLYKQQQWEESIEAFRGATALDKGLYPAELYIERCLELKETPPGTDWDGVFTMKTK
ncbi:MAG: adenylate/guanylate cyclase domain-containing protein [Deltaproteobacteria bacterium]|nr:adenylate/guanylate cyclase domain-containing protein [Deltaproteobacteria bacterium]